MAVELRSSCNHSSTAVDLQSNRVEAKLNNNVSPYFDLSCICGIFCWFRAMGRNFGPVDFKFGRHFGSFSLFLFFLRFFTVFAITRRLTDAMATQMKSVLG